MKVEINDEYGSHFVKAVNFEGHPAIVGEDYIKWEGQYHKNGKWSYTEGGIASKNVLFAKLKKSTHSMHTNQLSLHVIAEDKMVETVHIGKVSELSQYPKFSGVYGYALKCLFEECLKTYKPEFIESKRKAWEQADKFF